MRRYGPIMVQRARAPGGAPLKRLRITLRSHFLFSRCCFPLLFSLALRRRSFATRLASSWGHTLVLPVPLPGCGRGTSETKTRTSACLRALSVFGALPGDPPPPDLREANRVGPMHRFQELVFGRRGQGDGGRRGLGARPARCRCRTASPRCPRRRPFLRPAAVCLCHRAGPARDSALPTHLTSERLEGLRWAASKREGGGDLGVQLVLPCRARAKSVAK